MTPFDLMRATDPSDPVIFHEVTGRAANTAGVTSEDLLQAGASLVPPALRAKHPAHTSVRRGWPTPPAGRERWMEWEHTGLTGGIDHMAGDDKYVFFDLGWCRASGVRPAFGFRLRDVVSWCGRRVGFRPHDLISAYRQADHEYLDGLSKVDPEKCARLRRSVRDLAADPTLRAVMLKIATCATAFDAALPLARLHLLAVHRYEDTWDQAAHMVPRCGLEEHRQTPDVARRQDLPAAWALFWGLGRVGWPRAFREQHERRRDSHVEVVVGCPLPVRLARYHLGRDGWALNPFYRSTVLP